MGGGRGSNGNSSGQGSKGAGGPKAREPVRWVLLVGEHPPRPGGVGDYTQVVSRALAEAGEQVEVWAPLSEAEAQRAGPLVQRLPDAFGPASRQVLEQVLFGRGPCRVLLQYVPQSLGLRSVNLPFVAWLCQALAAHAETKLWVMFHEVALPVGAGYPVRYWVAGFAQRLMASMVARRAERLFVSTPAWATMLEALVPEGGMPAAEWLPVPSNVESQVDAREVARLRRAWGVGAGLGADEGADEVVIGTFGTYGTLVAPLLAQVLPALMRGGASDAVGRGVRRLVLIGRGSERFAAELKAQARASDGGKASGSGGGPGGAGGTGEAEWAERVVWLDGGTPGEVATHLAACDLLVQPYPDGLSCRRGSLMAGLALGGSIVSNLGPLSEQFWRSGELVAVASRPDGAELVAVAERLLRDAEARRALGARARDGYRERFSVARTLEVLLGDQGNRLVLESATSQFELR